MQLMRFLMLLTLCGLPLLSQAAPPPPWLAIAQGNGLFSSYASCSKAAEKVLNNQDFARVSSTGTSVMGAYRSGSNYQFKVAIKCIPQTKAAVVVVVTTISGKGLAKANSIVAGLRAQARSSRAVSSHAGSASISYENDDDDGDDAEETEDDSEDDEDIDEDEDPTDNHGE